uniref:isocitrate lyase/PEP mutase family protein n=1 Tax=Asaia astilbis TaxID=610244 RepID=UPI001E311628
MPNPWDAGSARLLTSLGFEALATTSAGFAFSTGRRDSLTALACQDVLTNAAAIVSATHLPVSADLGNGFGADPETCAETIRLASAIGLVGGSIEDATGDPERPIYDFGHAVDRVKAAVEAARDLPFILTARAESQLYGDASLDATIRRLQAFSEAGADVLYAPGLRDIDAIREVCRSVDKPVNVVMGLKGPVYSVAELQEAGVRRISVGGSLARAALGGLMRAAREIRDAGTFSYTAEALPGADLSSLMSPDPVFERRDEETTDEI